MWAGTVVDPPGETSAAIESVTSRSRSVALRLSLPRSALTNTLAKIGMVLRRSTTRWTCPSDFSSSARSTVTFIEKSASAPLKTPPNQTRRPAGATRNARPGGKGDAPAQSSQACRAFARAYAQRSTMANGQSQSLAGPLIRTSMPGAGVRPCPGMTSSSRRRSLFLQLPLKDLDLLGQRHVVADKAFDLAHSM